MNFIAQIKCNIDTHNSQTVCISNRILFWKDPESMKNKQT